MSIKAAVVGTGYLGSFHAEKYAKSENAELLAVVDIIPAKAQTCAARLGTKAGVDYRELPALGVQ